MGCLMAPNRRCARFRLGACIFDLFVLRCEHGRRALCSNPVRRTCDREPHLKKLFHIAGCVASCIAIVAMLGGHWLVLQSVAWSRMIIAFSQRDPLGTALIKTFDGKHPCSLCHKIRAGRQQEEQQRKETFLIKTEKMMDVMVAIRRALVSPSPVDFGDAIPFVPHLHAGFLEPPPTPPPREFSAVS